MSANTFKDWFDDSADLDGDERQLREAFDAGRNAGIRIAAKACRVQSDLAANQDDVKAWAWCIACESEVLKQINWELVVSQPEVKK